MSIKENVKNILSEIPENVEVVAAAKTRSSEEILEAIDAGIKIIGQNYISDLKKVFNDVNNSLKVEWHYIGTLQKNNIRQNILTMINMIETIDSYKIAEIIDKKCKLINKIMPVLIEINCAEEEQKSGIYPSQAEQLIKEISKLEYIKIKGLMTMGPYWANDKEIRSYFRETKNLFDRIKTLNLKNVDMAYLSMGMSDTYKIAIEEGANIVRIGTKIFGPRNYD